MKKIIMLGTGNGFVYDCYNTCFLLVNDEQPLLVDTAGSAMIVKNLSLAGYALTDIHEIFISHSHTDHLFGLFWKFKKLGGLIKSGTYQGELVVYCNEEVGSAIESILPCILPSEYVRLIQERLRLRIVKDQETLSVAGRDMTFFDVHARGNQLYGFSMILDSGKRLVFLGDETCQPLLYEQLKGADYVMHEAFCLDSEQDIFHPYEKHHSTVKSVCEIFQSLDVKNLILFHTEDTHLQERKKLYLREG